MVEKTRVQGKTGSSATNQKSLPTMSTFFAVALKRTGGVSASEFCWGSESKQSAGAGSSGDESAANKKKCRALERVKRAWGAWLQGLK